MELMTCPRTKVSIMANPQLARAMIPILSVFLSTFLLPKSSCESATRHAEKEALLSLERDWGKLVALNWSSINTDRCYWPGIICTDGFVTGISLAGFNLNKPIPSAICSFKNLVHIDLSNNYIPGSFPTALFNCSSLQHLDLSKNVLVGFLPLDIHLLSKKLAYLNLASNNLSNSVPSSIGQLHGLRFLYLDRNHFSGSYPVELGNLSNLEALSLGNNQFAPDRIHQQFGNLTNLKNLWMSNMNIIGEIPDSLSNLTQLRLLDVSSNKLSGKIPSWVWSLKNLEMLYLYDNSFHGQISGTVRARNLVKICISTNFLTGQIPEDFGKLKNLTTLSLYNNQLSGSIPNSIALLPMLQDVQLSDNALSGVLPKELGAHSMISSLDLAYNNLSGELPEGICTHKALQNIDLSGNSLSGDIPASLTTCSSLYSILLPNNKFTGRFPPGIWLLPKLNIIKVHDNAFTGSLPSGLGPSVATIDISNNRFSGRLPATGTSLSYLRTTNNLMSGEIPTNLIDHAPLQVPILSQNRLSGLLPSRIWYKVSLTELDLSKNYLSGDIPDTVGEVKRIYKIDLSENNLSGPIPSELAQLDITFLDLSNNQLSGQIPLALQKEGFSYSFLSNPALCSSNHFGNLPACVRETKHLGRSVTIFLVIGTTILICTGLYCFNKIRTFLTKKKDSDQSPQWKLATFHSINFNAQDILCGITHGNLVGSGGSGKVYRISLGNNNGKIAVKKICNGPRKDHMLEKQFQAEVETLGSIRHANIVKLLGCISSSESKLLIYEYMEHGSLYDCLHKKNLTDTTVLLNWPVRMSIAFDAARGLSYMHHDCSPPIAHQDVKSSNILLDLEFKAKIADFGLARALVKSGEPESISTMVGSFGYMAPEFGSIRKINEKVDVYSFGVVLLELTTGRRATGEGGEHENLAQWSWRKFQEEDFQLINIIDENIRDASYFHEVQLVFKLGLICTGTKPSLRPTMKEVLRVLQR